METITCTEIVPDGPVSRPSGPAGNDQAPVTSSPTGGGVHPSPEGSGKSKGPASDHHSNQQAAHTPRTASAPEQEEATTSRAKDSKTTSNSIFLNATTTLSELEVSSHNWTEGARIGEASNPGPSYPQPGPARRQQRTADTWQTVRSKQWEELQRQVDRIVNTMERLSLNMAKPQTLANSSNETIMLDQNPWAPLQRGRAATRQHQDTSIGKNLSSRNATPQTREREREAGSSTAATDVPKATIAARANPLADGPAPNNSI